MDLEKIISLGKQLGYKDADLQQFVTNEHSRSDKKAQEDLEREERRIKREIERPRDWHRYLLTIMDYSTRYPEAIPLTNIDTETVAEALVEVYARVGIPHEVLTDMGSQFVSDLMKEVSRLLSIKRLVCTPYHPICNGLVEKWNGNFKLMLKRMCAERPRDWHRYVAPLLFAYREAPNDSLKFSPFELLFGRKFRGPMDILRQLWTKEDISFEIKTTYQYVVDLKQRLSDTCELAHDMLSKSQSKYKTYYDRKARPRTLQEGEQVLILLPTDRNKLLMQWRGPYTVVQKINELDYRILMHVQLEPKPNSEEADLTEDTEYSESIVPMPRADRKENIGDVKLSDELTADERSMLLKTLQQYDETLTDVPGRTDVITCDIKLTTDQPIRTGAYPVPYSVRQIIKDEVTSMLSLGVIEQMPKTCFVKQG